MGGAVPLHERVQMRSFLCAPARSCARGRVLQRTCAVVRYGVLADVERDAEARFGLRNTMP